MLIDLVEKADNCPFGGLGVPFRWAGSALSVGWECPFGGLGVPFRWAGSALSVGWECPFGGLKRPRFDAASL